MSVAVWAAVLPPVLEQDDEELGLMQVFSNHIPVSQLTRPRESNAASAW